ncbi:hypothetical protein [Roseiarcus fermentans]|nr:hypothetical protein [Roseiarcus fermentans]
MNLRFIPRGALAAIAGAAVVVGAAAGPSAAFTLSAPSLAAPIAGSDVERVWWDRWGRWHPNRPWGWGPPPPRWGWGAPRPYFYGYYRPVRRCWVGPWGGVRCRWG